jgi:hypothetical protein
VKGTNKISKVRNTIKKYLFYWFYNFTDFVTLANRNLSLPEDDANASKHVGLLTI